MSATSSIFTRAALIPLAICMLTGAPEAFAQDESTGIDGAATVSIPRAVALPSFGRPFRDLLYHDPVQALLVKGEWTAPEPGDALVGADGQDMVWKAIEADEDGVFQTGERKMIEVEGRMQMRTVDFYSYLWARIDADKPCVMALEVTGNDMVYVHQRPRPGDSYPYGNCRLPVSLKAGANEFLFRCGGRSGKLKARLLPVEKPIAFDGDETTPDILAGEETDAWGALLVRNATDKRLESLEIESRLDGPFSRGKEAESTARIPVPPIEPFTVRKVPFRIVGPAALEPGPCLLEVRLIDSAKPTNRFDVARLKLRVADPKESHKRTFISAIDDSVQYFAVKPARPLPGAGADGLAMFLSLHGAGVEATNQANSYGEKTWGHVVAPTNRRPYGFGYQDWGRLDALEVLDVAERILKTDPRQVYVSGHSMGGHGSWHMGMTNPGRFAAIGPCSGRGMPWLRYRERPEGETLSPMERMLRRGGSPSDILFGDLARNLIPLGVYVVHGDADEIVPVEESRVMIDVLEPFHPNLHYHEEPGAGHWWGNSDEPGAECQDHPAMYDLFARRHIPKTEAVRYVELHTTNPSVTSRLHWLTIGAQQRPLLPSAVKMRYDPLLRRFVGTTENVRRLALDLNHALPAESVQVEIDGQEIADIPFPSGEEKLWLRLSDGSWSVIPQPPASLKGPHRYGPIREGLRRGLTLVYGTQGSPEENAWARTKARFDAEEFWYGGNGALNIMPDVMFDPDLKPDNDVILYGNAGTHSAWQALLAASPVQVNPGEVRVGDNALGGEDLACLFLRPRPDSDTASVVAVSGSGIAGMRLTDRLPYLAAVVPLPDCLVLSPEALTEGRPGVRAAGFFGVDWGVESGDFLWQE